MESHICFKAEPYYLSAATFNFKYLERNPETVNQKYGVFAIF